MRICYPPTSRPPEVTARSAGETILKTAFLLSENHNVIQSYLNHKGAHFKIVSWVGEQELDILYRQINVEKTNYAFVSKSDLEQGLRDDLWILADFKLCGGWRKTWQKFLLSIMYLFFSITVEIKARRLEDFQNHIWRLGYHLKVSQTYFGEFIFSSTFQKSA